MCHFIWVQLECACCGKGWWQLGEKFWVKLVSILKYEYYFSTVGVWGVILSPDYWLRAVAAEWIMLPWFVAYWSPAVYIYFSCYWPIFFGLVQFFGCLLCLIWVPQRIKDARRMMSEATGQTCSCHTNIWALLKLTVSNAATLLIYDIGLFQGG